MYWIVSRHDVHDRDSNRSCLKNSYNLLISFIENVRCMILTFPWNHCCKTFGFSSSNSPLAPRIVAYSQQANLSTTPGLLCSPLHNIIESVAGCPTHGVQLSRRLSTTPFIRANDRIAVLCPKSWVRSLPSRVRRLLGCVELRKGLRMETRACQTSLVNIYPYRRTYLMYGTSFPSVLFIQLPLEARILI